MSFGLSSTSKALIGAGAVLTAGVAGGVLLFNTIQRPVPDEKSAVATAAFAQADHAANSSDGGSAGISEQGASTDIAAPGSLCPEGMIWLAEKQGGVESCGTGRPPDFTSNPLDGVWEVYSPENPKVAAMTIFMHSRYGILHRTNPNHQSPAHAVWRMNGNNSYSGSTFPLTLSVAEDGSIETSAGQFGYCSCVKMYWRVQPTSDPNVMTGEWRYGRSGDEHGYSIWRRRPSSGIVTSVTIDKSFLVSGGEWGADQFDYGSRPGIIRRRHPVGCGGDMRGNCDTVWISVYGENFAGAHDIWIDPARGMELWEAYWICKNDERYHGHWDQCGISAPTGNTVAGVQFKFYLWDGMTPGPVNLWVDGQPIAIDIKLSGYPDENEKPELLALEAFDLENNKISAFLEGQPFILKAMFDGAHPDAWVKVEIPLAEEAVTVNAANDESDWGDAAPTKIVTLQRTADDKIFRSAALTIKPTEDGEE